jgi:hypothetical protein
LQDDVTYRTFIRPGVGDRELTPIQKRNADLSDSFLNTSVVYAKNITPESKARTLIFLIKSGLAYVDIAYERKETRNVSELLVRLEDVSAARDLEEIFNGYNICMVSPLMYTRLGEDILIRAGVDRDYLYKPNIIGMTLELYVKGTNAVHRNNWNLTSYKIGAGINEVDLVDTENNLLCEITVSDKRLSDVNLNSHFISQMMNRILSTKSFNDFVNGIRRMRYPKLCLMFDNKKLYEGSGSV